jgi:lipopolysaccharide export system permease protein
VTALDRYIATLLLSGWALVLAVLLAIFGLVQFVQETENISDSYHLIDAVQFVLHTLPQLALDLMPVAGLLGTLVVLANLARHSELTALRAAGMSMGRLFNSVLLPSALVAASLPVIAQFVSAPLYEHAEAQRSAIRSGRSSLLNGKGLWSNNGRRFFNVRQLRHGHIPEDIDYYEFDESGRLVMYAHAANAELDRTREWRLNDVHRKTWTNSAPETEAVDSLDMGPFWKREELPVMTLSTSAMSLTSLYQYNEHLITTGQKHDRIELALWQKLALPFATLAMIALAVPIGAGVSTQRSTDFARRLGAGALVGILFYLGSQIIQTSGSLAGLPIPVLVFIPVAVIGASAYYLFRRQY